MTQIIIEHGRFNILSHDKQWCVQLRLPDGRWISELLNEEPDISSDPRPSEIIRVIKQRFNEHAFHSNSGEIKEKLAYAESMELEMDLDWAKQKLAQAKSLVSRYERMVESHTSEIEDRKRALESIRGSYDG